MPVNHGTESAVSLKVDGSREQRGADESCKDDQRGAGVG
jgi:hypothetical protein